MNLNWSEIGRYPIMNADGDVEEIILERNHNGVFRIKNDFGNINFEFDTMTGVEFSRKLYEDIKEQIEYDLNDVWDDVDQGI